MNPIPTIDSIEHPYCLICHGTGKKVMAFCVTTQGITETKMRCYACNGTGRWKDYKRWLWNNLSRK